MTIRALLLLVFPVVTASGQTTTDETLRAPGLRAPVSLTRDRAGVVHIAAKNEHDLFFAQGWNVARDRLFQLELWRRRATGTMAEVIGARGVAADRASRLFRFRGDLGKDLAVYHPHGAAIVGAFVDGINAYIALTEATPSLLPPEFATIGIRPGRWTPAIVISRHNGLFGGASGEVALARLTAQLGAAKTEKLLDLGPAPARLDGLAVDAAALPSEQIAGFFAALRGTLSFEKSDPSAPADGEAGADALSPFADGSNNWVVAGRRTATGKPILANDPHRAIAVPSLRYAVHLQAPGWDVIGGGEPSLPGISIGHNRGAAWGLTIFSVDGEDLYEVETDPANALRYRTTTGWATMRVESDTIRVRGGAPVALTLRFTRHGPVIAEDTARHRAWALRSTAFELGTAPYLASLRMDQATTWSAFRDACSFAFAPAENMMWADTAGHIGWQVVAKAPRRTNYSGLVPMPGDGRFEWQGFLPVKDLPHDSDPAKGFLHSANENNVPTGYVHLEAVAASAWADPYRANRIAEVLTAATAHSVDDSRALQYDPTSLASRSNVPLLSRAAIAATFSPFELAARDTLVAWDHRMAVTSIAAGIYAQYERQLSRLVGDYLIPSAMRVGAPRPSTMHVSQWLQAPMTLDGAPVERDRDSLVVLAFKTAVADLTKRQGAAMSSWQYGSLTYHRVLIHHPFAPMLDSAGRAIYEVGPLPIGGDGNAPWVTAGLNDVQASGASFRVVLDLADFDRSVATNTPGQSGDPRSAHYRDLFPKWVAGTYFPLAYSAGAIARERESVTTIRP